MKKTYPLDRLVITGILLLSRAVVADNDPAAVGNHCLDHARKVVDDMHREVFNDMTADQSRQSPAGTLAKKIISVISKDRPVPVSQQEDLAPYPDY